MSSVMSSAIEEETKEQCVEAQSKPQTNPHRTAVSETIQEDEVNGSPDLGGKNKASSSSNPSSTSTTAAELTTEQKEGEISAGESKSENTEQTTETNSKAEVRAVPNFNEEIGSGIFHEMRYFREVLVRMQVTMTGGIYLRRTRAILLCSPSEAVECFGLSAPTLLKSSFPFLLEDIGSKSVQSM